MLSWRRLRSSPWFRSFGGLQQVPSLTCISIELLVKLKTHNRSNVNLIMLVMIITKHTNSLVTLVILFIQITKHTKSFVILVILVIRASHTLPTYTAPDHRVGGPRLSRALRLLQRDRGRRRGPFIALPDADGALPPGGPTGSHSAEPPRPRGSGPRGRWCRHRRCPSARG